MTTYRIEDLPAKLAAKIAVNPETGCWEWQGTLDSGGYGRVWWNGKTMMTHRAVYRLLAGPIEAGLVLDHVKARGCRSRACCWPAHLEPVTNRVNILRGAVLGILSRNGRKTHCPQGHEYTTESTYIDSLGRRNCRTCDRERRRALMQAPEFRAAHAEHERDRRRRKAAGEGRELRPLPAERAHCPAGHEYSEENTYTDPAGQRHCRQCKNERQRTPEGRAYQREWKRAAREEARRGS